MIQEFFDQEQMSAMRLAIDLLLGSDLREGNASKRSGVAHAVYSLASETGEFDPSKLAGLARERMNREASLL